MNKKTLQKMLAVLMAIAMVTSMFSMVVAAEAIDAPSGVATLPSTFEDGTRQGWEWNSDSPIKPKLEIEEANESKALSWEFAYPNEKTSDSWATAPRLQLAKDGLKLEDNNYLLFDLYLQPDKDRATVGQMKINLIFQPEEIKYWAQIPNAPIVDFTKLDEAVKTDDDLLHYAVKINLRDRDDITDDMNLRNMILVFENDESDFSGKVYLDNIQLSVTETAQVDQPYEPSVSEAVYTNLLGNENVRKPSKAGALQVGDSGKGYKTILDQAGQPIQLRGMSTHGLQWFPEIINDNAFAALANDWESNVIRLAMYVGESGYATNPETIKQRVIDGIEFALANDMYVLVDWHVHAPGDPRAEVYSGAMDFFDEISDLYPNNEHILYELANEPSPNNQDGPGIPNTAEGWEAVKEYAQPIVDMLREKGNENIIILGNPNWSQRPDLAADNPIQNLARDGADENTVYTIHFYTGTHAPAADSSNRQNVMSNALYALEKGMALFASEWGTSEASGNNGPFFAEADVWLDFLNGHNISWTNWSLTNKNETSGSFTPFIMGKSAATDLDPGEDQVWTTRELSLSGEYVRSRIKGEPYRPIDRLAFSETPWDFQDGSTQGFIINNDSPHKEGIGLANVNDALQISGLGVTNAVYDDMWSHVRLSADNWEGEIDILGAQTLTIDVIVEKPTTVSIAAIPQGPSAGWANPTAVMVHEEDFTVTGDVYKAVLTITPADSPSLETIAYSPENNIMDNLILFIGAKSANVVGLDNITVAGRRVEIPVIHASLGDATLPSDFEDGTRQGWHWPAESGVKTALTIEEANGSKALSWEFSYPEVKPSDGWASAPRLDFWKDDFTRGQTPIVAFDLYIDPIRATEGSISIHLLFQPPTMNYWAQASDTFEIDLAALDSISKTEDGLYHYEVKLDSRSIDKLQNDTELRNMLLLFADGESDFAGRFYIDNVRFEAVKRSGGGSGGGGSAGGGSSSSGDAEVVTNPNAVNGEIVVKIAQGKKKVLLPANADAINRGNKLKIEAEDFTVQIPGAVLEQLKALLSEEDLAKAQIAFEFDEIAGEDQEQLLAQAADKNKAGLKAASALYSFTLSVVKSDGEVTKLSVFEEPITLILKVAGELREDLFGMYFLAEDGTLEYAGGTLADSKWTADVTHFSTYAVLEYDKQFADVSADYWAADVIKRMAAKHIVTGVSVDQFAPKQNVTRAEFAALLVRGLELKASGQAPFADVDAGKWYAESVAAAYEAGIVSGRSATEFAPNATITREEMALMIVKAYERKTGQSWGTSAGSSFADSASISTWAAAAVDHAAELGLLQGRGDNLFVPRGLANRAESVQVIAQLLNK